MMLHDTVFYFILSHKTNHSGMAHYIVLGYAMFLLCYKIIGYVMLMLCCSISLQCTIICGSILHCNIVQHTLYLMILHNSIVFYITFHILHYTMLCLLCYILLCCATLYYTTLQYIVPCYTISTCILKI